MQAWAEAKQGFLDKFDEMEVEHERELQEVLHFTIK
jgi:hypothetical protein